ncbi:MAG: hypothetical protein TR69_WS6001001339 [candidate division WS6 bacterium OLB20]|uniref:Uncharacterized protein n=1 Tax=candidate division WS6 bacterium OLB20 TaxID=1617426 RepID=A0A136LWN7_9BACT|nr:MAG: hypothetical protein TR69_WS6001001339 [candidate division WS6 bacterium OLB20]
MAAMVQIPHHAREMPVDWVLLAAETEGMVLPRMAKVELDREQAEVMAGELRNGAQ